MSRPTKYTQEIADSICNEISTSSKSLSVICDELALAPSTVFKWLSEYKEFSEQYARAREAQGDYLADEIIQIADDATNDFMTITKGDQTYEVENKEWTSRSKLRVDARKWKASKLKPKVYGDHLDVTSGGEPVKKQIFKIGDQIIEL